jgi:hypothetical protein
MSHLRASVLANIMDTAYSSSVVTIGGEIVSRPSLLHDLKRVELAEIVSSGHFGCMGHGVWLPIALGIIQ